MGTFTGSEGAAVDGVDGVNAAIPAAAVSQSAVTLPLLAAAAAAVVVVLLLLLALVLLPRRRLLLPSWFQR